MLSLNLLSPQEKTASSLLWKYLMIKNVILIILTLSTVIAIVLFGAKLILLQKLDEVKIQAELTNITQSKVNKKINLYNSRIKTIDMVQKDFIYWSDMLYVFNNLVTPNITLNQVLFDINAKKITVSGLAATRDDLLAFKDSLSSCQLTDNITLPLNTLLKKQNVDFTMTADLIETDITKLNCIKE